MTDNEKLISKAKGYLGTTGGDARRYCGLSVGDPWCNAFVSFIFSISGMKELYCNGRKETYCPHSIEWCKKNLAEIPLFLAMPGDVIYFDWQPNGTPDHIGFVYEHIDALNVRTIEGNTDGGHVRLRTRGESQVLKIYRPHFKAKFNPGELLEIDGDFGYNSIYGLQVMIGETRDGILGLNTAKGLQRWAGAKQDGMIGPATTKKIQKKLKIKEDGFFGPETVKALQREINKALRMEKALKWAEKIAADDSFHYVNWTDDKRTHECPICKKHENGKFKGFNCIGFAFASWYHGAEIKLHCNNHTFANSYWNEALTKKPGRARDEWASKRIGAPVKVLTNDGKIIPQKELQPGDICARFDDGEYAHTFIYAGGGYMIDCTSGKTQISKRKAQKATVVIRYAGE